MSIKGKLLEELKKREGKPVSGQQLADALGVSRNAVWKAIHALIQDGYPIASAGNRGYCLTDGSDLLSASVIRSWLPENCRSLKLKVYREVDSTNREAARLLGAGETGELLLVSDTQTGLRGIPNRIAYEYLTLTGERFEYETTMLIESIKKDIPIREITIDTVYYDGNSETHFHPVKDSIRIYKLIFGSFIKYMFVSLSSFALDYGIFCLMSAVLIGAVDATRVWVATVVARVISSLYNYFMNRNVVFRSERDVKQTIIKYYALAIVQMCCSAGLVLAATRGLHWPSPVIKPIVDTLLFLLSYQIQSRWIFRE